MKLQDLSIEQLQEIVDCAPDGAEYYEYHEDLSSSYFAKSSDNPEFCNDSAMVYEVDSWIGVDDGCPHNARLDYHPYIKFSDIRAELLARPKFKVGDLVVMTHKLWGKECDYLLKVHSLESAGFNPIHVIDAPESKVKGVSIVFKSTDSLRQATPAEKAAGRRIDDPLISDEMASPCAVSDLAENNNKIDLVSRKDCQVCIEEETPELFESKHCSPRPMVDRELKVSVGQKHDQSKPRYSLIPSGTLASIVGVLEHGAAKYAPDNWKHVQGARDRYYNASMRHVQAWWSGEKIDSESGLPHLAHAICSLMFLMALDGEQGE